MFVYILLQQYQQLLGNCNVLLLQDYFPQINNRIVELFPVISLASSVFTILLNFEKHAGKSG